MSGPRWRREHARLADGDGQRSPWRRWGTYLSARQWGTVREDYSADGEAWASFPFEQSHRRAYRWGEDGLLGLCDDHGRLCLAPALWNERDPILKERLFGLTSQEGNHAEDLKELCWYTEALPSHAYCRAFYRYPLRAFPYEQLRRENERRGRDEPEYELLDTGILDDDRHVDLVVEYAKASPTDVIARFTVTNRGPEPAPVHLIAQLWFRNTWSWGGPAAGRPQLAPAGESSERVALAIEHPELRGYTLHAPRPDHLLFTDNDTHRSALGQGDDATPFTKDAFHRFVVDGERGAVNPARRGTRAGLVYRRVLGPGESFAVSLRLTDAPGDDPLGPGLAQALEAARQECLAYYEELAPDELDEDARRAQRAALAGLLWSKQHYHFDVDRWLEGDEGQPTPPAKRLEGPNRRWRHLRADHVLSVPDKWEFPWFASWDMAFHAIPLALVDPDFARHQLELMAGHYQHPDGQVPGYEWDFGDVNPPVIAWAAWRVYGLERSLTGRGDTGFLARMFERLRGYFAWWLHHHEQRGEHVFGGGRLGLDNIAAFNRSEPLAGGGQLEQADATGWMAMFAVDMLMLALELSKEDPAREADAITYLDHFVAIADAMHARRPGHDALFDEGDGFFYDRIRWPDGRRAAIRARSTVGLIPLFAVVTIEGKTLARLPAFARHVRDLIAQRAPGAGCQVQPDGDRVLLAPVSPGQMRRVLARLLDEDEFLSPHGIRSLSRRHADEPCVVRLGDETHELRYEPAESRDDDLGGNSNWRGPLWLPMNFLLIESLQKYHRQWGDGFEVDYPTGSGHRLDLKRLATALVHRLVQLIRVDPATGRRPAAGHHPRSQHDPDFRDHFLFHEYYDGEDGTGRGASHQTGWTALLAKLLLHLSGDETMHPDG